MKNILIVIVLLVLIGGGIFIFTQNKSTSSTPVPVITQTVQAPTQENSAPTSCTPSQLNAVANTDVAAGNAYVTLTIKNISNTPCTVVGDNVPDVGYPLSVQNFKTVPKGQPSTPSFTLAPNQTIYSLIHYPNGPQCSSQGTDVNSMVSYKISDTDAVTFKPTTGTTIDIPSCGKASDITTIDLYPFSNNPVTP